jgi:hypothetical protein
MRIILAIAMFALFVCSTSTIPSDVRALKGKPIGGVNLEEQYCKFEETASTNNFYLYMYFPCKDFTIAVNKKTAIVEGVYSGKK